MREDGRAEIAAWARRASAQAVLERVVAACGTEGIRVLPVKGIVTAGLLYEEPAARHIRDIDVRVAPADLGSLRRIARSRGWPYRASSPRLFEAVLVVDGWEVDVECSIGPPGLCAVTVDAAMQRAMAIATPFQHLEPELHDHALILVLNAFKDGLRVTPWALQDLLRIVRHERFDSVVLVSRARQGGVLSVLWIVADWLSRQERAEGWRDVRERVGPVPPSASVAAVYGYLQRHGWPGKPGLLAAATSNDWAVQRAAGLLLAVGGVARARMLAATGLG